MRTVPTVESLEIEFKSDLKCYPDHDLVEEIVGMANTVGGTLFLGVEDDGLITGLHKKHKDAIGVTALIANSTVPPIAVRAEIIKEEGKDILKIEVPRSRLVISTSSGKMLRRRTKLDGSPEVVPMFSYEISSRLSDLKMLDYSAQPLAGATLDDLDPNQRVRMRKIIQNRQGGEKNLLFLADDELDIALRLVTKVGDCYVPTVTGMLLLGKEERILDLIPTARSLFQVLEGTSVRMNEECSKPLLEVLENYETYLKAWNPEREILYGLIRIPIPEFDLAAFREGIVNAFCHRDYTIMGSVRVLIDDEGLTISNPGGFVDGVNLKNLLTVEPYGRNMALSDAMKRLGLAEKTGRGIDKIFEGSIVYGRPWPDYSESTSRIVKLFIQRAKADINFTKMIFDEQNRQGRTPSIYTLMVLSVLYNEHKCTINNIVMHTNLSEKKVYSAIERMLETGLIEEMGNGKVKNYILGKKMCNDNKKIKDSNSDFNMHKELVLQLAEKQVITKQDVVDLLQVSATQAYTLIKKLQHEGKLEMICGGKYSKYKRVLD